VITDVRRMLSCHFTARRLQRYLDADPSAPLAPAEIRRLEEHLSECARCASAVADFRSMRWAMLRLSRLVGPEPAAVARLRRVVDELLEEERR
jgi:anti-sigma factor RsiW